MDSFLAIMASRAFMPDRQRNLSSDDQGYQRHIKRGPS